MPYLPVKRGFYARKSANNGGFDHLNSRPDSIQLYLHTELNNLKASTDQPLVKHLSQHDVIALVDDRLSSLEKRKAQELLSSLEEQFRLAQASGPDNRLIYVSLTRELRFRSTATPAIRILDNQIGHGYLLKGYRTPEQLLLAVQQILSQM